MIIDYSLFVCSTVELKIPDLDFITAYSSMY